MRLRAFWGRLSALPRDPRPLVRYSAWGSLAVVCALLLSALPAAEPLRGIWVVLNIVVLTRALALGIRYPRETFAGAGPAFRWAFWGSLVQ